jgi:sucrose-phosphate synthase
MKEYYIQLFSPHGLIRFNDPEIGRDKDTGGQVKYVLELLENLSHHPQVRKVDLFTRRIIDKRVSAAYEREVEKIKEKARIVRMSAWSFLQAERNALGSPDEFIDKRYDLLTRSRFSGCGACHYADGNYAGQLVKYMGSLSRHRSFTGKE